jgi:hypothetical protein
MSVMAGPETTPDMTSFIISDMLQTRRGNGPSPPFGRYTEFNLAVACGPRRSPQGIGQHHRRWMRIAVAMAVRRHCSLEPFDMRRWATCFTLSPRLCQQRRRLRIELGTAPSISDCAETLRLSDTVQLN